MVQLPIIDGRCNMSDSLGYLTRFGNYRAAGSSSNSLLSLNVLDTNGLEGALAAFSFRKLRNAYAGSCVRVRRSNDNVEADIPFSGNWIDKAAVNTHCGTNDGFIATFYDQSGNGNNIISQSAATQFKLWNGSTQDWQATIGGRPACTSVAPGSGLFRSGVIPSDNTNLTTCVICGFSNGTSTSTIRPTYDSRWNHVWMHRPYDPEVSAPLSDFIPEVTPTANTSYVSGKTCSGTSPTTTRIRFAGTTYTTTSITYGFAPILGYIQLGLDAQSFLSPFHTVQEAIWWLRDIGDVGLTKYSGNCLSSAWYGNVNYI